jgi:hypothetical protein
MSYYRSIPLVAALLLLPTITHAAEDFLAPLAGSWQGKGMALTRIGAKPINVTCSFTMQGNGSNLSMDGTCRGLLVVRRNISARLRVNGQNYTGTYTGPSGQPSSLSGSRQGDAINLTVRWARVVNGDRTADMTFEKIGANRLRLQTIDKDLATGKQVVTSRIDLSR